MKQRKTLLLLLLALTLGLLSACGGEDAPLSTGEQGGQVAAPDTLEGDDDTADGGALEAAEDAAVDNEGQNVDEDVADESVSPGDAETIGDSGDGQGGTSGSDDDESTTAGDDGEDMDSPAFVSEWESAGATVTTGGEVPVSLFDGAVGQTYIVDDAEFQVYQFEDEAAAEAAAATVSSDGGMINDISLRWAGTPHFYRMGDTIIFYVGDDAAALERLNGSFGTPFAGSSTNE
jgi:hypothetical protein